MSWYSIAPLLDPSKTLSVDVGAITGRAGFIYRQWQTLDAGHWRFDGEFIIYDEPGRFDYPLDPQPPERHFIPLAKVVRIRQVDESDEAWERSVPGVREALDETRRRRQDALEAQRRSESAEPEPVEPPRRRRWWQ